MTEIEFNNCSRYTTDDYEDGSFHPCSCPVCGGFLPSTFPTDGTEFNCKKCGSELFTLEVSEEFKESDNWEGEEGRICVATRSESHKGKQRHRISRQVKQGWKAWKAFL